MSQGRSDTLLLGQPGSIDRRPSGGVTTSDGVAGVSSVTGIAGVAGGGGGLHNIAMATDLDTESMYWSKEDCAKLFKREIVHRELITSFGQDVSKVSQGQGHCRYNSNYSA